jgi:hypothetical protein
MACSDSGTGDEIRQSISLSGALLLLIATASALYLINGTHSATTPRELPHHFLQPLLAWRALASHTALIANVLRIVLGYVQCANPHSPASRQARARTHDRSVVSVWCVCPLLMTPGRPQCLP